MKIDITDDIAIVTQDKSEILSFIESLNREYDTLKPKHLIIDLLGFKRINHSDLMRLLPVSNAHRLANKSFVIVSSDIDLDVMPEELIIVPTLQEAHDIIEMESIERDLGL